MFKVKNKTTCKQFTVFGTRTDKTGYPHFLIRVGNQWLWVSAKHFEPVIDGRLPGDLCNILVFATRYALGRKTTAPSIVMGYIESVIDRISDGTLLVLERDIREADSYGDEDIDEPDWMDFLDTLHAEIGKRGLKLL